MKTVIRYHLMDHELGVCPLRFLTKMDVVKQSNGQINLSNLKMLIKYLIEKWKEIDCYADKPSENYVNDM